MWAAKGVLIEEAEACYRLLEIADANARVLIHRCECSVAMLLVKGSTVAAKLSKKTWLCRLSQYSSNKLNK